MMNMQHEYFFNASTSKKGKRQPITTRTSQQDAKLSPLFYPEYSPNAPFIAIVSCIKSKGVKQGALDDPAKALRELLPSIYTTITDEERANYRVEIIFGYDDDDAHWMELSNQLSAVKSVDNLHLHQPVPVSFVAIQKRSKRIPFNELTRAAYDAGAKYIVRINDDTEFVTSGWITLATKELQSFNPPNVGVVGPTCNQGNLEILTHDMVSRWNYVGPSQLSSACQCFLLPLYSSSSLTGLCSNALCDI
eukprot:scaffold6180_cov194-Alexandrium_tamarense.AAC.2